MLDSIIQWDTEILLYVQDHIRTEWLNPIMQGLAAMGATMMIGLQTFIIIGGVIKLIPLTGITMPFVSSGGSSLVSNMCLTGLIQGVASLNEDDLEEDLRLTEM